MIRLGDGDSDLHRHDWQMNTIDGPTKLVRQDAILGGLSIGQLKLTTELQYNHSNMRNFVTTSTKHYVFAFETVFRD